MQHIDLIPPTRPRHDTARRQQLQRIPQGHPDPRIRHLLESRLGDLQSLGLHPNPDDALDLFGLVSVRGNDEEARQEVGRNAVRGDDVFGAADGAHAPVGGEDDDGGDAGLEGAVEVGEAFDVEHVDLGYDQLCSSQERKWDIPRR